MTVEYLDLADYVAIAPEVTGLDLDTILKVTDLNLADSAVHAPAAGFGGDRQQVGVDDDLHQMAALRNQTRKLILGCLTVNGSTKSLVGGHWG